MALAGILGFLFYLFGIQDGGWLGDRVRDDVPQDSAPDVDGDAGGGGADADGGDGSGAAGAAGAIGAGVAEGDPNTAVADRLWGCLRRLEVAQIDRDFDAGYAALSVASGLSLNEDQRRQVEAARGALAERLGETVALAREKIDDGRVLEAAELLRALYRAGRAEPRAALATMLPDAFAAAGDAAELPAVPPPPKKGERVRVSWDGSWVEGRVRESDAHEVTVQIHAGGGVFFPTVPRARAEPVGADAAACLDQAIVARHSDDVLAARLWLSRAESQGGVDPARAAAVRRALY